LDHAAQIADTITRLGDDQFAIFDAPPDESYVQVRWTETPGLLHCEAVDFERWEGPRAMTDEMHARLIEMGYALDPETNYVVESWAHDPGAIRRTAELLAWTLHEVYGVSAEAPLSVLVDE
jgi:hypothetical protein